MKRFLPILMLLMTGAVVAPAKADLIHRLTSSTSLTVDGALTVGTRLGSTYAVSGSNVEVASGGAFGGLTAPTSVTAASAMTEGSYDITTDGASFSFSESFTYGDAVNAIGSGVDVSSGVVADMPAYGSLQTNSGGVAGTLAGTLTSAGAVTLTAGGAGTNATGQFVSEITIN